MNVAKMVSWPLILGLMLDGHLEASIAPWPQVAEGYWANQPIAHFQTFLWGHPEVTVDNIQANGQEIYGPQGLLLLLQSSFPKTEFINLTQVNKSNQQGWPTPEAIGEQLQLIAATYPDLCQLFSLGKSEGGRELWVLKISRSPHQDLQLPEIKFVANMHGNEILGRDLLVRFASEILALARDGTSPEISQMIDNSELFLLPSLNPDGAALFRRGNNRHIDLNRDFPTLPSPGNIPPSSSWAQETRLMMAWQQLRHFSFSANFHCGNIVANYPWDYSITPHPFTQLLESLALSYTQVHPVMLNSLQFPRGIVQGASWYTINGSMQDWSTFHHHDLQITVELSKSKIPPYQQLENFYQQNRASLINFWKMYQRGIGLLTGANTPQVQMELSWRGPSGEFIYVGQVHITEEIYLPLLPGDYQGKIHFDDHSSAHDQILSFQVPENFSVIPKYLLLHL